MHRGAERSEVHEGEVYRQLELWAASFLDFCRIEKGLAPNSIASYRLDLKSYAAFCPPDATGDVETVRSYVDSLYKSGLTSRSIARHLTTLRNFYQFLLREGKAWISAPAGDGKRRFYALEERDIPTYLAGHGLLSAGQPCPKLMPAEVPLARVLPPHDGVPPMGHLVLIAEDERKSREHACEVLRGLGYSVVLAGTGLQAVRLSQSLKPATILLDGLMPEMHGFEVARLIRHLDRSYTPRILAVTAIYKAMRYQNEAKLKYGIDGYLIKPLTTDAIAAALEQARAA